jgi:REP element-mobilizing transposase RayT
MGRPPRLHAPGATYHVTLRGNHRQDIFFVSEDRLRLNALLADATTRFNARLHAYCYMSNHVHLLIQVGDTPLSSIMLRVAGQYARQTQARLQTTGHLFEKRYYAALIDVDQYLLTVLRYIHLNPVQAGLAESPDSYPWSSHHAYTGTRIEPWVTTDFALSLFGSDRPGAISAYQSFLSSEIGLEASQIDECITSDARILGSDVFAQGLLGMEWKPKSKKSLDNLIDEACKHFNCEPADLGSASRRAVLVSARAWIVNQAVAGGIASVAEVARKFNRDESSLRHALKVHGGCR